MNMRSLTAVLLLIVMLLGSACARESRRTQAQTMQITLTAVPFPAVVGETRLVIRVSDSQGRPVDDAVLAVKGDMTHAGMAPVLAESAEGGEDGYYNLPFEWTMGGDWVVTVEATRPDGSAAQERFDLNILTADEAACIGDEDE